MFNYQEVLNKKVNGVLATMNNNSIETRVFQSLWVEDNKVYFCTGSQKDVYDQLLNNPEVSFCVENKFNPVISVNGNVVVTDDLKYKEEAFKALPMLKNLYQTPENPDFKVFYIDVKKVKTFSYAEGPKEYIL